MRAHNNQLRPKALCRPRFFAFTNVFGGQPVGLRQSGSTDNTFLFTGEQFNSNVGQYYLRARYYNQAIGRFTQLDTYQGQMSDPATLHKYLYTGNDPVNMIDPTGHMSIGGMMAVGIRVMGTVAMRATRTVVKVLKRKTWLVFEVALPQGIPTFEHEFIWAKNLRKKNKGVGFHVWAAARDMLRSKRNESFVDGKLYVLPQKKINVVPDLGKVKIKSRKRVGLLGKISFLIWSADISGKFWVTCNTEYERHFSYRIKDSSCKHWTADAARKAKLFSLFPF